MFLVSTLVLGNNNNQRVLQGGKKGLVDVWLQVQRCDTEECLETHLVKIVKMEQFWTRHTSSINIGCSEWGVAGIYRHVFLELAMF